MSIDFRVTAKPNAANLDTLKEVKTGATKGEQSPLGELCLFSLRKSYLQDNWGNLVLRFRLQEEKQQIIQTKTYGKPFTCRFLPPGRSPTLWTPGEPNPYSTCLAGQK